MKKSRQFVAVKTVMNIKPKLVRMDNLAGKDYKVVPMVMMVEGVHSGSEGPYLYTANELGKRVEVWNRKPVVVYHPDTPTACTKEVLNTRWIGDIMNAKWDKKGKRLLAEAWLDEERVKKVDNRILEAIDNEETLELSTGLFADSDEEAGEWNGEEYQGILTNYGPDHLAVLPDQVGACSVEDGAGFYRNSEGQKVVLSKSWMKYFNELSQNTIRDQLRTAIAQEDDRRWVEDVFETTFVWSDEEGRLYQQNYKVEDDKVSVSGIPVAVYRKMTYEPITNKNKNKERKSAMDKEKMVDNLISNKQTQWEEDDREYLMNLDEDRLQTMQPKNEEAKAKPAKKEPGQKQEETTTVTAQNQDKEIKPLTEEQYMAQMPESIRNRLQRLERMENEEKDRLIGLITKNPNNTFTEEWLKTQDVEMLQNLVNISVSNEVDTDLKVRRFNYGLNGGTPPSKDDTKSVPVLNCPGDVKKKETA